MAPPSDYLHEWYCDKQHIVDESVFGQLSSVWGMDRYTNFPLISINTAEISLLYTIYPNFTPHRGWGSVL
ncbi:hypothetical protein Tco_0878439 [Tanacetum coccineum]|uniref:Uncharacterized protein n=1 Tax=Tanacetum coccineum TaxID=301880 RepID=A0ABQ5BZI1_9ASTR